ncbi:hypothetical protein EV421DRAFT_2037694 [Armillaria borealis]|uniref:Uncharacterized protein n=1 Tax=Armillaria borealis TaxID=47425 RepID=A0AA39JAT2_9AGAR|nr:hypothetical protein EV421DRAFT_2037694 [Armillaria borealis]
MASLFHAYNALLIRRSMLAQCGTAALLFGTSDIIEKKGLRRHDARSLLPALPSLLTNTQFTRTVRLTFYGGTLFGPVMTWWYQFLNCIQFASPTRAIAVLTPFAVGAFFTCMSVLEGVPQETYPRIQAAYVPTILRNWGVFIPTQIHIICASWWLVLLVCSGVSAISSSSTTADMDTSIDTYLSAVDARQAKLEQEEKEQEKVLMKEV